MDELLREVESDPSTLGLILHGSRATGSGRPGSDYDLIRDVSDEEYDRRPEKDAKSVDVDVILQTPARLRRLADDPGWWTASFLSARVLVDKTGEIEGLVRAIVDSANVAAYGAVPEAYDGYLNCWVRSLKAWRRGDELSTAGRRTSTRSGPSCRRSRPRRAGRTDSCARRCCDSRATANRIFSGRSRHGSRRSWPPAASSTAGATTSSG